MTLVLMHSTRFVSALGKQFHVNVAWLLPSFTFTFTIVLFRIVMHRYYLMRHLQFRVRRLPCQILDQQEVMESLKMQREVVKICPEVVSCADILAVAARDASTVVGGPSSTVKLGRRDSTSASKTIAETDLPNPFDPLDRLISSFSSKGLNARDMVALSVAHTIGQAYCFLFRDRIYGNGTDIDAGFASTRRRQCPQKGENGNLAPLDLVTPNQLDNNYFKNLIDGKGLLQSDQVFFSGGSTDSIVSEYSNSPRAFSSDFVVSMIKMEDISPLTGQNGIKKKVCGSVN
ncbi:hypothetical protein HAX54_009039 [Datura stramonium]|uniref:Peroxidase n=1 Tax=Datura stramonium TaxID=4076 RepID=A0ABS8TFN0_DATST|nr:hypothetical protein [Datura stramonium]